MTLTPSAMATLANNLIGQRYSWGGQFENRDCSATMRDLFTPFGIWLPRNSKTQAQKGARLLDLTGLSPSDKRDAINEHAIPFFSLIGMKGHIGLYLGYEPMTKMPIMLHDVWGVKTNAFGREGRAIIGKVTITTLRPGEERWDVTKGSFYNKIRNLQILPGTWEK